MVAEQAREDGPGCAGRLRASRYDENAPVLIAGDSVLVPAIKHFCFAGPCLTLAHGIGDMGGVPEGGNNTISLVYLHLDAREYGESVVATSTEPDATVFNSLRILSIHPNPFSKRAVVEYVGPRGAEVLVEVFDILGRRMRSHRRRAVGIRAERIEVDGNAWATGIDLVQIKTESGEYRTSVMVLRK